MIDLQNNKKSNNNLLWKYAGFATQLAAALAIAIFVGLKFDKWIGFKNPIAVWVLPLLVILTLIFKVIKDTAPKK